MDQKTTKKSSQPRFGRVLLKRGDRYSVAFSSLPMIRDGHQNVSLRPALLISKTRPKGIGSGLLVIFRTTFGVTHFDFCFSFNSNCSILDGRFVYYYN